MKRVSSRVITIVKRCTAVATIVAISLAIGIAIVPPTFAQYAPPGSVTSPVGPPGSYAENQRQAGIYWNVIRPQEEAARARPATTIEGVLAKGYTNGKAWGKSRRFRPSNRTINCVIAFNGVMDGSVQVVWVATNITISPKNRSKSKEKKVIRNQRVAEGRLNTPTYGGNVFFTSDYDWPKGSYRVDVYVNGKIALKLPFTVA
ncbi:MAG: hypothetical protein M3347_07495 [Armatimonadota bacterium]|nr:hypothetical protein [Armatimonadota bacterium]